MTHVPTTDPTQSVSFWMVQDPASLICIPRHNFTDTAAQQVLPELEIMAWGSDHWEKRFKHKSILSPTSTKCVNLLPAGISSGSLELFVPGEDVTVAHLAH